MKLREFLVALWFAAGLLAAGLGLGCGGPPRKPTAAEWLKENTIILEQLRSYDRKERQKGIHRFLKLGKEQGTEVVTFLLDDPKLDDYRIELVLARILAEWKDLRAIPYLLRNLRPYALGDGTGWDQGAADIALEGLMVFAGDPRVLAAAGELVADPDARLRLSGATLLAEMQEPRALDALARRLEVEEDREVRAICLAVVLASHHPRRRECLVRVLSDPETEFRREAWESLVLEDPPARFRPHVDPRSQLQALGRLHAWAGLPAPAAKGRAGPRPASATD